MEGVGGQESRREIQRIFTILNMTRRNNISILSDCDFGVLDCRRESYGRNTHGDGIVVGDFKGLRHGGTHQQRRVAENNPSAKHLHIIINIQHVNHAVEDDAAIREILAAGRSADQEVNHSVLSAHRGVPRLVDGGADHADGTRGLTVVRGAQPGFCEAGTCMIFTVDAGHRKDERQLADIG